MEALAIRSLIHGKAWRRLSHGGSWAVARLRGIGPKIPGTLVAILALLGLGAMVLLPIGEAVARRLVASGVPSSAAWVQHLTLWVGLFGAVLASVRGRHLSVAVGEALRTGRMKDKLDLIARGGAIGVLIWLTYASGVLVYYERSSLETLGGWLPVWIALAAMPVGFAAMALATFWKSGESWKRRAVVILVAAVVGPLVKLIPIADGQLLATAGIGVLLALAAIGMPLYAVLGGVGLLLFYCDMVPVAALPATTYQIVTQAVLPSIPLFALAGVVLARGGAPERLTRLVRAWIGWAPGGSSIATILACAFFTAITGASGVTILALGGLLFPILLAAHHKKQFSLGLVTASGSVGLLFFPSLPVILYAVCGRVAIDRLFVAALLPGIILLAVLAAFSIWTSEGNGRDRPALDLREIAAATWVARGDLLLPVLIVGGYFSGLMTLVEVAAMAALWAIVLETGLHRSLPIRKELSQAFVETAVLIGALIAVIGLALGLYAYLVDALIPTRAADWVTSIIESKWVFLLVLNLLLLLVGALMDIYSAILVVAPLLVPLGVAYGIHPAHLGVIFLANLELGYLTPPVGMNLFLSSLTFEQPLLKVWRAVLPFLAIFAAWVLLITYVPWLSSGFSEWVLG